MLTIKDRICIKILLSYISEVHMSLAGENDERYAKANELYKDLLISEKVIEHCINYLDTGSLNY